MTPGATDLGLPWRPDCLVAVARWGAGDRRQQPSLAALTLAGLMALPAQAQSPDGAALFAQHCAPCHQPDGTGTVGLAPSLKGDHWVKLARERSYIPTVLINGLSGPITVNGARFSGSMPPFGPQLDDAQMAAVTNHLRQLQGTPADEATYVADEFKAARQQPGSPPQSRVKRAGLIGP
ncbi:MAG: hypothetical protein RL375_2662 [Pseudomonadota bacterium]